MVSEIKNKSWFRRHWIISIFLGLFILGLFGSIFDTDSESSLTGEVVNEQFEEKDNVIVLNTQTQDSVEACNPNYQCGEWSECSSSGTQIRTCTDLNNCNILTDKPEESQSCIYAYEEEQIEITKDVVNDQSDSGSSILITKSPIDMLPANEEIDTEWEIVGRKNASLIKVTGFDSGAKLKIYRLEGTILSEGYVFVYKFDSITNADSYYQSEVDFTKEERGYTEISSPINEECFAIKSGDYLQGYYKWAVCKKANIVFISEVDSFSNWRTNYYEDLAEITTKRIR